MPIIKINNKIIYYAHVPKCAGTSVEEYLFRNSDSVSFLDRDFFAEGYIPWSTSSPQHIDGASLGRLFPDAAFFDDYFTVVRNPVKRFISAFKFNKYIARKRELRKLDINKFVSEFLNADTVVRGFLDNHFLPSCEFLIPERKFSVFRMEEGLVKFKDWFDLKNFDNRLRDSVGFEQKHTFDEDAEKETLSEKSLSKIFEFYHCDFETFKYTRDGINEFNGIVSM